MLKGAVLYAKNLEDLVAFYVGLGGQILDQRPGEYGIIGYEDGELSIVQSPDRIASQIVVDQPPTPRAMNPLKPVFSVSSLNDCLNAISLNGGLTLPGSNTWEFRGNRIQDVVDPEGNIIQLQQAV